MEGGVSTIFNVWVFSEHEIGGGEGCPQLSCFGLGYGNSKGGGNNSKNVNICKLWFHYNMRLSINIVEPYDHIYNII